MGHVASVNGRRLDRHQVGERRGTYQHSSGVLGQPLGKPRQLLRQGQQVPPAGAVSPGQQGRRVCQLRNGIGFQVPGQRVDLIGRQAQRLAQIAHDAPRLIGGKHAGQGGVVPPPLINDAQDQPFPNVPGEVQVNVRQRGGFCGQEPVQRESVFDGINVGQPD